MNNQIKKTTFRSGKLLLILLSVFFTIYFILDVGSFVYHILFPLFSPDATSPTIIILSIYILLFIFLVVLFALYIVFVNKRYKNIKRELFLGFASVFFVLKIISIIFFLIAAVVSFGTKQDPSDEIVLISTFFGFDDYVTYSSPLMYIAFVFTFILFVIKEKKKRNSKEKKSKVNH